MVAKGTCPLVGETAVDHMAANRFNNMGEREMHSDFNSFHKSTNSFQTQTTVAIIGNRKTTAAQMAALARPSHLKSRPQRANPPVAHGESPTVSGAHLQRKSVPWRWLTASAGGSCAVPSTLQLHFRSGRRTNHGACLHPQHRPAGSTPQWSRRGRGIEAAGAQ